MTAPDSNGWLPIDDDTPTDIFIIVWAAAPYMWHSKSPIGPCVGYWEDGRWHLMAFHDGLDPYDGAEKDVTHWQPFPKPPVSA